MADNFGGELDALAANRVERVGCAGQGAGADAGDDCRHDPKRDERSRDSELDDDQRPAARI